MPIPALNRHGLLPSGVHQSTLAEAEHRFCWNAHREGLWKNLLAVLCNLHEMDMAYPIFLGGSFFSAKPVPMDIDIVHDLRHACLYNQFRGVQLFRTQRDAIKAGYGIDYCVNIAGNNDFSELFQYVGSKTAALTGLNEKDRRGVLYIGSRTWLDGLNR